MIQLGFLLVCAGLFGTTFIHYIHTVPTSKVDSVDVNSVSKNLKRRDVPNNFHRRQSDVTRIQGKTRGVPGERSESQSGPRPVNITVVDERQRGLYTIYYQSSIQ